MKKLFIGSDNLIEYDGLARRSDNTYISDASVSFALKDVEGDIVAHGTMPYITASDGKYVGVIEGSVPLDEGSTYFVEVTVAGAVRDFRRLPYLAVYRTNEHC